MATWLLGAWGMSGVWKIAGVWERSPDRDPELKSRDLEIAPTTGASGPTAWLLALLLVLAGPTFAEPAGPDPLFAEDAVLKVSLRGPLTTLAREKSAEEQPEHAGTLSYTEADGRAMAFDIVLQGRGHSRRRQDVCKFPPLWVDLPKKKTLKGTLFEGQNKLKLVTFCRPTDRHQQFLLKEYVAYRLFNHLTDNSFRVRLLQVDYVDADRDDTTTTRWGFFIEHKKRLAKRLGYPLREPIAIEREQLDPEYASRIEVFNYLLGNTDYSLIAAGPGRECCHNSVLLELPDQRFMSVPYDFDMTGFVDPPYQMVSPEMRISNVRQRLFRGYCWPGDYTRRAVEALLAEKAELLEIVRSDPRMDERSREKAAAYLESGFAILEDPKDLERRVLGACR